MNSYEVAIQDLRNLLVDKTIQRFTSLRKRAEVIISIVEPEYVKTKHWAKSAYFGSKTLKKTNAAKTAQVTVAIKDAIQMLEQKNKRSKPWYTRFDRVHIAIGTIIGVLMLVIAVLTYFKPDAKQEQVENNTIGRDQIKADKVIINNNYGDTLKPKVEFKPQNKEEFKQVQRDTEPKVKSNKLAVIVEPIPENQDPLITINAPNNKGTVIGKVDQLNVQIQPEDVSKLPADPLIQIDEKNKIIMFAPPYGEWSQPGIFVLLEDKPLVDKLTNQTGLSMMVEEGQFLLDGGKVQVYGRICKGTPATKNNPIIIQYKSKPKTIFYGDTAGQIYQYNP